MASIYSNLNKQLEEAIHAGALDRFIDELQSDDRQYSLYLTALFLARAYAAAGKLEEAAKSYENAIGLADPTDPNTAKMVNEVIKFADDFGFHSLHACLQANGLLKTASRSTLKPPAAQVLDPRENFTRGRTAFNNGQLEEALVYLERAFDAGERNAQLIYLLGQTLQRLRKYDDAIHFLDNGLRYLSNADDKAPLINLKGQIYSSQQYWQDATRAYEELLHLQSDKKDRAGQRRFTRIQLANIYRRLNNMDAAVRVLDDILEEFPQDQQALRLKLLLRSGTPTTEEKVDTPGSAEASAVEVELVEERTNPVSPMLQRDIELAGYRDEKILRRGEPNAADADRLLRLAEKSEDSEFVERFPLFLEAAKAYNDLPEFSYELENFYRALARYAILKGGALVSQFQRAVQSDRYRLEELRRLRDSAKSYSLEALVLQANVDPSSVLIALNNHLFIQLSYVFLVQGGHIPEELLKSQNNLASMLRFAFDTQNEAVLRSMCEAVVEWGASMGKYWNLVRQLPRGTSHLGWLLEPLKSRTLPYRFFGQIVGEEFEINDRPGKVFSIAFQKRRNEIQQAYNFFTRVQQIPFKIENFSRLSDIWQEYKKYDGVFLDTDRESLKKIDEELRMIAPYEIRTPDERTSILVTARNSNADIQDFIEQNTTYWGRVILDPLLTRWQAAIRNIEEKRSAAVQPILLAELDPAVFTQNGEKLVGGLVISNTGRGTSEGFNVNLTIKDYANQELHSYSHHFSDEIRVDGKFYLQIDFPIAVLPFGVGQSYMLWAQVTPFYRGVELDAGWKDFTLEIGAAARFELNEIIWDELRIPEDPRMFKGRDDFIRMLADHLKTTDRARTYILVGLTRTGKSSILTYLARNINLKPVTIKNQSYRFVCFLWDLAKASAQTNAADMWEYLLKNQTIALMEEWLAKKQLVPEDIPQLRSGGSIRLKDWDLLIDDLHRRKLYPVFLIDEFSHYKNLVDKQRIDSSFLAKIRSEALEDRASFVFAGTYDLRKLIQDPTYGITGQLVNAMQKPVSSINEGSGIELIQAMDGKLVFTPDAIEYILYLSGRIPYFIQLICKRCAMFAHYNKRSYMGPAEVDAVIRILTGEADDRHIGPIDSSVFMNNMIMVGDPPEFGTTLTTICDFVRKEQNPRYVAYSEIMSTWDAHGIKNFQRRLSNALGELKNREVLLQSDDEGQPAYKINVDLFRRWWSNENPYLRMALDILKEEDD